MAVSFIGSAASQKIIGDNQDYEALAILENGIKSTHNLRILRAVMQIDVTAASTNIFVPCYTYRGTGTPSLYGACKSGKGTFDTSKSSDPEINFWFNVSLDAMAQDSGFAGTSGVLQWKQCGVRMRTAAEQQQSIDNYQLPYLIEKSDYEWYLRPGEYVIFRADPTVATDNSQANNWFVQCAWLEEPVATYTISGVVTLAGDGVVGAEVSVIVADDNAFTNSYLATVVTTIAGGAWSCDIPSGKIAYAYAQDYTGGTYYRAPGIPYVS